jgi:formylglycine-generating enzyme required for sulfatase activity
MTAKYRESGLFDQFRVGTPNGVSGARRAVDRSYEVITLNPDKWQIRIPTEWEWQWAAMNGTEKWEYPWGEWQVGHANTSESGLGRATAVGMYPHGKADCGALDMSGNLFEWCANNKGEPEIIDGSNTSSKVLRGGSFADFHSYAASSSRYDDHLPYSVNYLYGVRLVVAPIAPL